MYHLTRFNCIVDKTDDVFLHVFRLSFDFELPKFKVQVTGKNANSAFCNSCKGGILGL